MEEEVKQDWTKTKFSSTISDRIEEIKNGKRQTALQRLAKRYHSFSCLGLAMTFWSSVFLFSRILEGNAKYIITIMSALYFLLCSTMAWWLYLGISKIDCSSMTVSEVARLAVFYRKRHLQFMLILIPFAFSLVGTIIYFNNSEIYFIWGIIFGLIFGLAIGIRFFMEFMSDYKDVTQ